MRIVVVVLLLSLVVVTMSRYHNIDSSIISKITSYLAKEKRMIISKKIPIDLHSATYGSSSTDSSDSSDSSKKKKRAAVLIPLCTRYGKASILFTVRSNTTSTHKGQVSFPGGHIDDGETAIDAAIRETYEETGININTIHILGNTSSSPSLSSLSSLSSPSLSLLSSPSLSSLLSLSLSCILR